LSTLGRVIFVLVLGALAGLAATRSLPLGLFVGLIGLLVFLLFVFNRTREGANINNRGLTLMGEGRLVDAIDHFERAQKLMPRSPMPGFNTGLAKLWLWRLEEARVALEKATSTIAGKPLRIIAAPALTLIAALQNDQARFQNHMQELGMLQVERGGVASMAKAVMAARARSWREVLDTLSLERTRPLGGPARAIADALRCWATVEVGGRPLPIDFVGVFGETGPSAVKQWWPEFAAFLEARGQAGDSP